jgi:hypothetical protein
VAAPAGVKIRDGRKRIEGRRWRPDVLPLRDLLIVENRIRLSRKGVCEDPSGRAMALVDVASVSEWKVDGLDAAAASYWEPGWLAWRLENVRRFDYPHPIPAKLRIYKIRLTSLLK